MVTGFATFMERLKISGGKRHRFAEAVEIDKSSVLDYSDPLKNNVSTSIDCYVSGHYMDRKGNVLEVKQRYTVYVQYTKDTIVQAINGVRKRILDDFQSKYHGMKIDEVFIPELIKPLGADQISEDEGFYYGSKLFKEMTKSQKLDVDLRSAADMYKRNLGTIKRRYH